MNRTVTVTIRMTESEFESIKAQAAKRGMAPRTYLRYIGKRFPELDSAIWQIVLALGNGESSQEVLSRVSQCVTIA